MTFFFPRIIFRNLVFRPHFRCVYAIEAYLLFLNLEAKAPPWPGGGLEAQINIAGNRVSVVDRSDLSLVPIYVCGYYFF